MDVHRDFCEIAIAQEGGRVRSAGRIDSTIEQLTLFAQSLAPDDIVALEATSGAGMIAEVIRPHVGEVVVANTRRLPQISRAKAKTDRLDARMLARLAASGFLETVWAPDEQTRALRRLCARREALVRARTRAKNEAHAVPARNLCGRPPVTDAFGKCGRQWLVSLALPVDERLTLDGCLRQVDLLDIELAALDRALAERALGSPEIRRLMTIPGVNVQTAAAFLAAVGDIQRFPSARQLVGYLGLDPRVRQSGNSDARHGHISKTGSSLARGMLGEAAWSVAQNPGSLESVLRAHPLTQGPTGRSNRDCPQAGVLVLVPIDTRAGLRLRSTRDDTLQDSPARARRGRRATTRQGRCRRRSQDQKRARSRAPTRDPSRDGLSPDDR